MPSKKSILLVGTDTFAAKNMNPMHLCNAPLSFGNNATDCHSVTSVNNNDNPVLNIFAQQNDRIYVYCVLFYSDGSLN